MATLLDCKVKALESTQIRVTSDYGMREHPLTGQDKMHNGIDLVPKMGQSDCYVLAIADGVVIFSGFSKARGDYIKIDHGNGFVTLEQHLKAGTRISKGKKVKRGDRVGRMGSTGNSTGPHLHLEVQLNGEPVDPKPYLLGTKKIGFYTMPDAALKQGAKGDGVRWVQWWLNKHGADLTIDGDFGQKTDAAVRAFQKEMKIKVDGIVGPETKSYLTK